MRDLGGVGGQGDLLGGFGVSQGVKRVGGSGCSECSELIEKKSFQAGKRTQKPKALLQAKG